MIQLQGTVLNSCCMAIRCRLGWNGGGRLPGQSWRIWAENAPYDLKDKLKARNYRWSDGSDGRPRSWWTDVGDHQLEAELEHLRSEIYGADVDFSPRRMTAFERHSAR